MHRLEGIPAIIPVNGWVFDLATPPLRTSSFAAALHPYPREGVGL